RLDAESHGFPFNLGSISTVKYKLSYRLQHRENLIETHPSLVACSVTFCAPCPFMTNHILCFIRRDPGIYKSLYRYILNNFALGADTSGKSLSSNKIDCRSYQKRLYPHIQKSVDG